MMKRLPARCWLPENARQAVNRDEFDDTIKPACGPNTGAKLKSIARHLMQAVPRQNPGYELPK